MPKRYSLQEKETIRGHLKQEAASCMAQYGIRKTTVDELVKRTNIPKGTFYLFYKTKEHLLFEVLLDQQKKAETAFQQAIKALDSKTVTADEITDVILDMHHLADTMPVLQSLRAEDIELLAAKLPRDVLLAHFAQDNDNMEILLKTLPGVTVDDPRVIAAAFRAIFMMRSHRKEIGEAQYESALRFLVHGLVVQIMI